ncbi:MAG: YfcE family phosphodiesterase [Thermoplasmata archaeon]|nr:YfcE family phosphodiesterase [Candidatus Sysuiplasma jiujiangense]MBX8641260.1 YfcE family phosphodiesterase [Candidatus Sysuiplasma jiujiangense]
MKKIAVISDIHSNMPALSAVFRHIEKEQVDEVICAGDIVGYNAMPNEVIELLREKNVISIAGNHDSSAVTGNYERMNSLAARALELNVSATSSENFRYLRELKPNARLDGIAVFHGSPFDPDEYVYEDMADAKIIEASGKQLTVLGHTHIPYVKRIGKMTVMNPGSVGQPRDGDARASFAIIDGNSIEIRRTHYDIDSIFRENMKSGIPLPLSERLRWGV